MNKTLRKKKNRTKTNNSQKDVAGKISPRLFFDRHDRLVQTDWPLARSNQLRIVVTKKVAAEVKLRGSMQAIEMQATIG